MTHRPFFPRWRALALLAMVLLLSSMIQACGRPDPCLTDDDCLLKNQVCRGNLCREQTSCKQDNDCKYKGEICREQKCIIDNGTSPPPPSGCPAQCYGDNECKDCKNGRTFCIHNICVVKTRAPAYARCGSDVGKACEEKMVCSGGGSNKYCLPECDPKQKRCSDGKSGCYDPSGKGAGLCLPDGEGKEGGPCHVNFQGKDRIDTLQICKNGLRCVNFKCVKPAQVKAYHKCGGAEICGESATCVVLSQDATHGFCLPDCNLNTKSCDGGKGTCQKLPSGKGVCLPNGTAKEFSPCGPSDDTLQNIHLCTAPLRCVGLIQGGKPLCLKVVSACHATACANGQICLSGSSSGVCALACTNGTTCPNGLQCKTIPNGTQPTPVCVP